MSTDKFNKTKKSFERLAEALEAAGIKKYGRGKKIAEISGYSESRTSEMLSGKLPLNDKFKKIVCGYFRISEEFVDSGTGQMFLSIDHFLPRSTVGTNEIPVLGIISAGFPNIASQEVIDYISIPGAPKNSFALVVRGASMEPTFRDGDYVLFIENGEYRSNDVLIVLDEWGEAMVKRLKDRDGKRFLTSDNPSYPTIEPNEHYRTIGKVVKVWRDIKF